MTEPTGYPHARPAAAGLPGPPATISYIYDRANPSEMAIFSVATRLQGLLIEVEAIPEGASLPFPALDRRAS